MGLGTPGVMFHIQSLNGTIDIGKRSETIQRSAPNINKRNVPAFNSMRTICCLFKVLMETFSQEVNNMLHEP